MSDKPIAGLVTAIIIAPLVVACCVGPVALMTGAAAMISWIAELPAIYFVLGTVAAGLLAISRRRRHKPPQTERVQMRDANV